MVVNFHVTMVILVESPISPTKLLPNISIIANDSEVAELSYHQIHCHFNQISSIYCCRQNQNYYIAGFVH